MKNKKSKKLVALISLISVFFITISVTMAWFYMNSTVEVEYGSEIVCEAGTSLEISMYQGIDEETGEEKWTPYSGIVRKDTVSAKLQDITGSGEELFRVASLASDENGDLYPAALVKAVTVDENGYGDYIELKVRLRSTSKMDVYFSGDSFVNPVTESEHDINVFGDFSKDYIAGAMRVAVLEKQDDDSLTHKMTWAPNPTFQLTRYKDEGRYTFTKNGEIEKYKYYRLVDAENEKYELYDVTPQDLIDKKFVIGSTQNNDKMINNSPVLTTITPEEGGFGVEELTIRVWFEGTDREADQALSGGQAHMNLIFSGMESKDIATEETYQSLNNITATYKEDSEEDENGETIITRQYYQFANMNESMYFTLDGYNWTQYQVVDGIDNLPNIHTLLTTTKQNVDLYIKYKETLSNQEAIRKMTFVYEEESEEENDEEA